MDMAFIKDNSTGAMRERHKLLGNCLYGRLAKDDNPDIIKIVSTEDAINTHLKHRVLDNIFIDDNKQYIRYSKLPDILLCKQSGYDYYEQLISSAEESSFVKKNNSSAIAAATAS